MVAKRKRLWYVVLLTAVITLSSVTVAIAEVGVGGPLLHSKAMTVAQVDQEIVIGFDQNAVGNDIPHDTLIDEQYAALGIHFNGVFYTARRVIGYPEYKTTTTLNLLCTNVGASGKSPDTCRPPIGGGGARLEVDLDFPVEFASIEGRTRADGVFDSDFLIIEAFDADGNLLDSTQVIGTNDPPPYTTEGVLVAEVSVSGIRRLVVNPGDTDALDTLTLRLETPTPEADLVVTKSDSPDPVNAGDNLTYTIEVTNNGPSLATDVVFTDTLPTGVSFVSATPSQGSCSEAGGTVTCDLGDLAEPAIARSTFDVDDEGWTIFGDAIGPTHFPAGGNPGGYISAVDQITGAVWYWVAPAKFLSDVSAAYQHTLTFDLKQSDLSNPFDDSDVVLAGGGLTLVFDTPTNPGTDWTDYSVGLDETAGWEVLGTGLPPTQAEMLAVLSGLTELQIRGEYRTGADTGDLDNVVLNRAPTTATITIVVAVDPSLANGTVLINTAEATADEPDSNPSDNTTSEDTTVTNEANLAVAKADSSDPVSVGDSLTYTVEVTNNGPSDATGVTVTDVLPTGVTFVSVTPDPPTCTEAGGTITCDLGTLAAGASTTVNIEVTVEISAVGTITNTASVTANEPDPDPSDNTDTEDTGVQPTAIELVSFSAEAGADHVTLTWETASELDNEGFNLWRSQAADGPYSQINPSLIPARGNVDTGANYEYVDPEVVKGVTYYYKLEDVDLSGMSTFHGPVSATASPIRRIYLPLIVK